MDTGPDREISAAQQRILELEERLKAFEKENVRLSQLAGKDGLTGLDNRRRFDEEIIKEIHGSVRTQEELSVIFVDIDKFKPINDTCGHKTGDKVLQEVAAALSGGIRLTDSVSRYGGDEFVLLLPATSKPYAVEVALRLLNTVNQLKIAANGQELSTRISIGVNSFKPGKRNLPQKIEPHIAKSIAEELTSGADKAMYAVKHQQRVGVIVDDDLEKLEIDRLFDAQNLNRSDIALIPK